MFEIPEGWSYDPSPRPDMLLRMVRREIDASRERLEDARLLCEQIARLLNVAAGVKHED